MNEVGSWSRRDFFIEEEVYSDREEGGSWLLEQEAYCWKWTLAHGR